MQAGEEVICLDNYFTGRKVNVAQWIEHPRFELIRHDVTEPIKLEVDRIWHLACPASPVHYQFNPIKTAKTSFLGTYNMLGLARRVGARLLLLCICPYCNYQAMGIAGIGFFANGRAFMKK